MSTNERDPKEGSDGIDRVDDPIANKTTTYLPDNDDAWLRYDQTLLVEIER